MGARHAAPPCAQALTDLIGGLRARSPIPARKNAGNAGACLARSVPVDLAGILEPSAPRQHARTSPPHTHTSTHTPSQRACQGLGSDGSPNPQTLNPAPCILTASQRGCRHSSGVHCKRFRVDCALRSSLPARRGASSGASSPSSGCSSSPTGCTVSVLIPAVCVRREWMGSQVGV